MGSASCPTGGDPRGNVPPPADRPPVLAGIEPSDIPPDRRRGRGAQTNRSGRYEAEERAAFDDGWSTLEALEPLKTEVTVERPKRIISRNRSPDVGFEQSINPYRGCEHGCVYCFARPTHAFHGLSAGLDFETRLFVKPDAPALLEAELAAPGYVPRTIALGMNTDAYQPIERTWRITRQCLEVLDRHSHPVALVTKSANVLQDLDVLARMADRSLVKVAFSLTTLDARLARAMEPRAATPSRRLEAMRRLHETGIPVAALVAPVIPALTDHEMERLLEAAAQAGAKEAGYVLLRLPLELRDVFKEWLVAHCPDRAAHVVSNLRAMRGGRDYDAEWGTRMRGTGPLADLIARRFAVAARRLGLNRERVRLRTDLFRPPPPPTGQLRLL